MLDMLLVVKNYLYVLTMSLLTFFLLSGFILFYHLPSASGGNLSLLVPQKEAGAVGLQAVLNV